MNSQVFQNYVNFIPIKINTISYVKNDPRSEFSNLSNWKEEA